MRLGQALCKTAEELKAWSQNLGHENVMTTVTSYGNLDGHRLGQVIKAIGMKPELDETPEAESKRLILRLAELQSDR